MAYIIAVENPKGGSGKSTVTAHLARYFQIKGYKVLIVDRDPQGTLMIWAGLRNSNSWAWGDEVKNSLPLVMHTSAANLSKVIGDISKGYDVVFLDGSSKTDTYMLDSIKVADFVLMPCAATPPDVWGLDSCVEVVQSRIKATKGELKAAVMFNRYVKNEFARMAAQGIKDDYKLPLLTSTVKQYIKVALSLGEGVTVFEFNTKVCKIPAAQFATVGDELIEVING